MFDIRCKLCRRLASCSNDEAPDFCGNFRVDMDKLVDLATEMSKTYKIEYTDALHTIDMGLRFGGYVND